MLIVEVHPSFDPDLHMAAGYSDGRFYRRGEQSTQRMTEPDDDEGVGLLRDAHDVQWRYDAQPDAFARP